MNYRALRDELLKMSSQELLQTATVYDKDSDEYRPITSVAVAVTDVLDNGHIVLTT